MHFYLVFQSPPNQLTKEVSGLQQTVAFFVQHLIIIKKKNIQGFPVLPKLDFHGALGADKYKASGDWDTAVRMRALFRG